MALRNALENLAVESKQDVQITAEQAIQTATEAIRTAVEALDVAHQNGGITHAQLAALATEATQLVTGQTAEAIRDRIGSYGAGVPEAGTTNALLREVRDHLATLTLSSDSISITADQIGLDVDEVEALLRDLGAALGTTSDPDTLNTLIGRTKAVLAKLEEVRVLVETANTSLSSLDSKDFATETKLEAVRALLAAEDFATETTLATLLANDFATETTLEALRALVAAEDFASQTTLAALEGKDFATAAKQDVQTVAQEGTQTAVEILVANQDTLAPYKIADSDTSAGATRYYGFLKSDGAWYIMRERIGQPATGQDEYRYTAGAADYPTSWTGRAGLTYDYLSVVF